MKQLSKKLKILLLVFSICLIFFPVFGYLHYKKGDCFVIGAKNCVEQNILSEILAQLVELHTDIPVKRCFNLDGTSIAFTALLSKTIDVYFEYTGTAFLDILKEIPRGDTLSYLKEVFAKKYDLLWQEPVGFTNQYSLIVRSDSPFKTISDISLDTKWALDPEFFSRMEFALLKKTYSFNPNSALMDQAILFLSLASQTVDVISGDSTDGHLFDSSYRMLEDDKGAFPKYAAVPLVRRECLEKFPELAQIFALISEGISDGEMRFLNHQVEVLHEDIAKVSRTLLIRKGWVF